MRQVQFLKNRRAGAFDRTRRGRKRQHQLLFKENIVVPASRDRHESQGTSVFAHEHFVHELDSGEIFLRFRIAYIGQVIRLLY